MAARLCSASMRSPKVALVAVSLLLAPPALAQDPPPPLPPADVPTDPPPPSVDKPAPLPPSAPPSAPEPPASPEPRAGARGDDARTLKGYTFRPPLLLDTAFVGTHAGLVMSIGRDVTSGVHALTQTGTGFGQELVYDLNQSFVSGRLQAGASFAGRVEIGIDMTYAGFVVGDQNTALLYGGQSAVDVEPGVRVSILKSASTGTALGVRGYASIARSTRLNPARVLAAVADKITEIAADPMRAACLGGGDIACAVGEDFNAFAAMRVSREVYGGGVAVSLAQAIGSHVGVQATTGFEIAHGRSVTSTTELGSTPFKFYVGVAPAVDFAPTVPIGIMAEYRFAFAGESFSSTTGSAASTATRTLEHGVVGGVYYTGRRDLTVGLGFSGTFVNTSVDVGTLPATHQLSGLATMRYYF